MKYRSAKRQKEVDTDGRVKPSTLKGYIGALNSVMKEYFPRTKIDLFSIKSLMTIIDNYFQDLQHNGGISNSHNTLSLNDVRKIFEHLNTLSRIGHGYRDRFAFAVGLATVLYILKLGQLRLENV